MASLRSTFFSLSLILVLLGAGCAPGTPPGAPLPASPQAPSSAAPTLLPSAAPSPLPSTAPSPHPSTTPSPPPPGAPSPLPSRASTAPAGCRETAGKVLVTEMPNPLEKGSLRVSVYLPPCYSPSRGEPYPVLILLHGTFFNDDQWPRIGAAGTADRLIAAGRIPPMLIVMPRENNTLEETASSSFEETLLEVILPWVRRTYHASPQRDCWALGGLSRGAYWALHIGLKNTDLFSSLGGHSLPNEQFTEFLFRDRLKAIPSDQLPRIYLDSGIYDMALKDAEVFEALLTKYNVPHTWQLNRGGHDEVYWSAHVADYLLWYASPWFESCPASQAKP